MKRETIKEKTLSVMAIAVPSALYQYVIFREMGHHAVNAIFCGLFLLIFLGAAVFLFLEETK